MVLKGEIKKGEYYDSVTLMNAARRLNSEKGVLDSAIVMATQENKGILKTSGLLLPEFDRADGSDLVAVVKADNADNAAAALARAWAIVKEKPAAKASSQGQRPNGLSGAMKDMPDANLIIISVAGRFAGTLAMDALSRGLNVMLFSDNISLETEIELKRYASSKGLLVMGPDCGTAIINGAPLAFANAVNRGDIGMVAAAGTGLQEVTAIVSNEGAGVSQAIGTGGRDVKKDVGGISFLAGLQALAKDPQTKVILLVSKPPHESVLRKIAAAARKIHKPVVAVLLGDEEHLLDSAGVMQFDTLEEAALVAAALSRGHDTSHADALLARRRLEEERLAIRLSAGKKPGQKHVRGLFSGGTFASEAQLVMKPMLGRIKSNVPFAAGDKLANSLVSEGHSVIDLGEDEFTVGRPHPMIDFSLRNKRIEAEAADPSTAVILLDVVIGYGANQQPLADITPAIKAALKTNPAVSVICSVTGTDLDPQNRQTVTAGLKAAGATVMPSNASACRLAALVAAACSKPSGRAR